MALPLKLWFTPVEAVTRQRVRGSAEMPFRFKRAAALLRRRSLNKPLHRGHLRPDGRIVPLRRLLLRSMAPNRVPGDDLRMFGMVHACGVFEVNE